MVTQTDILLGVVVLIGGFMAMWKAYRVSHRMMMRSRPGSKSALGCGMMNIFLAGAVFVALCAWIAANN